jgi:hypothetical protein
MMSQKFGEKMKAKLLAKKVKLLGTLLTSGTVLAKEKINDNLVFIKSQILFLQTWGKIDR